MLPSITTKQKEIILYLYRFRFLNRIQIQNLLNHKSPKNSNVWLKDLTQKQYINRIFKKVPGINKPAIYYISKNGIKFLKSSKEVEESYLKRLNQEYRRSEVFIEQCIQIAEIFLDLYTREFNGFKFYTQVNFPANGKIIELSPTFAFIKKDTELVNYFACEIIKDNMPRFAIRDRIKRYLNFFENNPATIIFICQNKKLRDYSLKFALKSIENDELENIIFKSTLFEDFKSIEFN